MGFIGDLSNALTLQIHHVTALLDQPFLRTTTGKVVLALASFLILSVGIVAYTYVYTNLRYRYQMSRLAKDDIQQPPAIPYSLPFLGSALQWLAPKPGLFWKNLFSYHPRSTGACTLLLGGQNTHILFDAAGVAALFKAKEPTRDRFNELLMANVFGLPETEIRKFYGQKGEIFQDEKGNEAPTAKQQQENVWHEYLIKTDAVAELTQEFTDRLKTSFQHDKGLEDGATIEVDMSRWIRDHMFKASTDAFMGTSLLETYPEFVDDFWEFDKAFLSLFFGLPKATLKKEHAALQKVLAGTRKWHRAIYAQCGGQPVDPKEGPSWEPILGARVTRARHIYFNERDLNSDMRASADMGILFGISSNAIPCTSWMIMHIIDPNGDKTLLPRIMEELKTTETPRGLDISKLISLPLLQSTFQETLRLYTDALVTRDLPNDLILLMHDGKKSMKFEKGSIMMAPSYLGHHDAEKWDTPEAPSEIFYAERFLKTDPATGKQTFSMNGTSGKLFPFGGGKTICPGRVFAKQEVLGAVAIILLGYDLTPITFVDLKGNKTSTFPGLADGYGGNGIMAANGDLRVSLRKRKA